MSIKHYGNELCKKKKKRSSQKSEKGYIDRFFSGTTKIDRVLSFIYKK